MTSTAALLARLEPLSYPERMAAVAAWARDAANRDQVIEELRAGSSYERFLALTAADVAGDRTAVIGFLGDPDHHLRASAVKRCLRAGWLTDDELKTLTGDAPAILRRLIYRYARPDAADALIDDVRDRYGDREAAWLLPNCGPATVRRLLPELDHVANLGVLARRRGDALLAYARDRLTAATPTERRDLWNRLATAVVQAGPAGALDLLEEFAPDDRLPGRPFRYGRLATHDPGRVARLLAAPGRATWLAGRHLLTSRLARRLAALDDETLTPLARGLRQSPELLAALPPARRGPLHDAAWAGVNTAARLPGKRVMEVLPHDWRTREADRVLGLPAIRRDESQVLTWTAYLPWERARGPLGLAVRSSDAGVRAQAYELLVGAARRSRDPRAVADAIEELLRLRNEQDPVRQSGLSALAGAAPLITAASIPALTRIVADAAEARDASGATFGALRELAVAVLRHHVADAALAGWAMETFDVVSRRGHLTVLGRLDRLPRGREAELFERLRGWVESAMKHGQYFPLFAVTRSLGRRARGLPELQRLLERAIERGNIAGVVSTAVTLWLDDPATRDERVAKVLARDSSTVVVPPVWDTLCARRTDLLDKVLRGRGPRGQFLPSKVRWVPARVRHAERWLPRQREAFVALQARVADDRDAAPGDRGRALAAAARAGGRELVLRFLDAEDVGLAEAALGAFAYTPEALPVLLERAGTDRARVAFYAAGRAIRSEPPSRLPALLGGILLGGGKVTSRKQAARLLAMWGPPAAMETLRLAYRQADQHKDVRAAIVAGARLRPRSEISWEILTEAAHGGRAELDAVVRIVPDGLALRDRPRYAALIAEVCRSTDHTMADFAFRRLPGWLRYLPEIEDLVVARLTGRYGPDLADLVGALLVHPGAAAFGAALRRLAEHDEADDTAGDTVRDRPARRRITTLAAGVAEWARRAGPEADRRPALAAARELAARPAFEAVAATMRADLVEIRLPDLLELITPRPLLAARVAERLGTRVRRERESLDPANLGAAAQALAARGDLSGGLLALALTRVGAGLGWPPSWRDVLVGLRGHPDAEVREAAFAVDMRT